MGELPYGARMLARNLGTALVIPTLAVRIGATTATFIAINAILFDEPLHVIDPEGLVTLYTSREAGL